ncbi:MAG: DUF6438 domain-containing protein [Polaribacter sp.]
MKYIFLFIFVFALSCNPPKKEKKQKEPVTTEKKSEEKKEEIVTKEDLKTPIKTEESLLVVLKNPKNIADAKSLVENSSLVWKNLLIDKNTVKVAEIKIPIDKKDFWIERLKAANVFSKVTIKSDEILSEIKEKVENTFVTISKTQCSGDCPVYEMTILKNGNVLFNGIENVSIKGKKEFTITDAQLQKIKEMFTKTSFGTYLDTYVDKSLMDYPSTFITYNDKQIEIKLWKNVPDELAFAYESVEDILIDKKIIE